MAELGFISGLYIVGGFDVVLMRELVGPPHRQWAASLPNVVECIERCCDDAELYDFLRRWTQLHDRRRASGPGLENR